MNFHFENVLYLDFGAPFSKIYFRNNDYFGKKKFEKDFSKEFFFLKKKSHDFLMKNKIPKWDLYGIWPQAHLSWDQA